MKTKLRPRIGLRPTGLNMYFHQYPNLKDMGSRPILGLSLVFIGYILQ